MLMFIMITTYRENVLPITYETRAARELFSSLYARYCVCAVQSLYNLKLLNAVKKCHHN